MKREDIRNLLGGYAAGTLTPAEQKLLFDAALEDQELFDALADEQALKEILDDPESRGFLRAALAEVAPPAEEEKKRGFWQLSWQWTAGLATAAAALTIVTVIGLQKTTESTPSVQVAAVKSEAPQPQSAAAPKQPPVEVADARVANQPPPKTAAKPAAPAPPPSAPIVAAEARGEESKSTDKKKEAEPPVQLAAAAPPPPPASAPVLDSQRAAGPSASQLYLAQFRQTQLEQQQQQLPGGPARAAFSQMGRVAEKDAQRRDQEPPRTMAKSRAATTSSTENTAGGAAPADAIAPTRSIAQNPGIRYEILRRNSQNQFIATRIDTRFEEGDEIVIAVNKNAGGIVSVLQKQGSGWQALPLASQTLFDARTAPVKLARGTLDLVVVLSSQQAAAAPPSQTRNQVSETLGNAVYVVTPGQPEGPVAAQLRITVH